jgi:hypothetical protein
MLLMSIFVSLGIKRDLTAFNFLQMIASKNQPVKWTSPVGLPVVQPYKKYKNYMVRFLTITADVSAAFSFSFSYLVCCTKDNYLYSCIHLYTTVLHPSFSFTNLIP